MAEKIVKDSQGLAKDLVNDCISRKAAIDAMEQAKEQYFDRRVIIGKMQNVVSNLPSAQPEIIRCKDCRWQKDQSGATAWLPCRALVTPEDFYCGRAERRTDG